MTDNLKPEQATLDIMLPLDETMKFIDWVSDNSYKRCINGEWIQLGTGDYKTVAKSTVELYALFKENNTTV